MPGEVDQDDGPERVGASSSGSPVDRPVSVEVDLVRERPLEADSRNLTCCWYPNVVPTTEPGRADDE